MTFGVVFLDDAIADLQRLDRATAQRILDKIRWASENFDSIPRIGLKGSLRGLYKLRVGDYRVIYTYDFASATLTIHRIGHRRDLYEEYGDQR